MTPNLGNGRDVAACGIGYVFDFRGVTPPEPQIVEPGGQEPPNSQVSKLPALRKSNQLDLRAEAHSKAQDVGQATRKTHFRLDLVTLAFYVL